MPSWSGPAPSPRTAMSGSATIETWVPTADTVWPNHSALKASGEAAVRRDSPIMRPASRSCRSSRSPAGYRPQAGYRPPARIPARPAAGPAAARPAPGSPAPGLSATASRPASDPADVDGSGGSEVEAATLDEGEHRVDDHRVPLVAGALAEAAERLVDREGPAVGPVRGHRIERVGHRDHPRAEGDRLAGQPVGVARPIERLVVMADDGRALTEEAEPAEDPGPDLGVEPHRHPLLGVERPGLQEDPVGDTDLAEVVDGRRLADELDHALVEAELLGDRDGVDGDPLGVVVGRRVAMVDDLGEAADGIAGLALELADVAECPGDDHARDGQEQSSRPARPSR